MHSNSPNPCDRASVLSASSRRPIAGGKSRLVLATCILASSLAFVDGSVVNVGLPAIGREFAAGAAGTQWVINAYLLPLSALLLFGGALGDRFGLRQILVVGLAVFVGASTGCAVASSLPILQLARGVQGVGAAMMLPASLAILGASFDGEARARAVGIWAAASAIGAAVGPALGGWLIDTVGWRAIFLINLPLGLAAVALALASIASHHQNRGRPLDFVGAFFATIGLGGVAAGLTLATGPNGFDGLALSFVCSGLASGMAFILTEIRKGEAAMTPTALIASRVLFGLNLLTVLIYGALTGFLVMLPFVLIETGHQSATSAGAILLPFPLVMLLAGPAMGKLETRFGTKLLLTCGPFTVAAGFVAALGIDPHDSWTASLPCVLLVAAGMAATAASLTNAILSRVDEGYIGSASGLNSALARGAGLIATALLGHVLSARGDVLLTRFHAAVLVCAGVSLAASACAIWTLRTE